MIIDLDTDTLQNIIDTNKKVVVQFSASWCGNCRIMKPKFKKMASENENIAFVIIDSENAPLSRALADVSNLPTFASFNNGVLVNETQTNKTEVLSNLVTEIANL